MELYILMALMIAGAVAAVEMKNLLSAVIAVGVVGLGLSVVFLLLKAPDIALTQLVVDIMDSHYCRRLWEIHSIL